ncbi:MAG TPA: thiol:disulfide interchange protein DsbA/DsbL [Burkholderiales bacterium]|jgi:thiol:disulfide interchange protein DsbA|nr:thiol:disulfide interchange protein DsbA/DsbL [Burkholderiales bacterium]
MNRVRRALVATISLAPLAALAQRTDYVELNPPQPVETTDKIEVLEFFWYGCIHCYNLEPKLETWLKTLPKDVEFRRVPAVFNERWAHDASIYYAFEAMGLLDKLHRPFFDSIHRDRLRTDNWQNLAAWLEKQGVDTKKFETTFKSFGVQSKTKRAIRLTTGYKIDGTPAMAVHGRYTVPSSEGMLGTVNQLVAQVRKQK